jgi:hypothetical protein
VLHAVTSLKADMPRGPMELGGGRRKLSWPLQLLKSWLRLSRRALAKPFSDPAGKRSVMAAALENPA